MTYTLRANQSGFSFAVSKETVRTFCSKFSVRGNCRLLTTILHSNGHNTTYSATLITFLKTSIKCWLKFESAFAVAIYFAHSLWVFYFRVQLNGPCDEEPENACTSGTPCNRGSARATRRINIHGRAALWQDATELTAVDEKQLDCGNAFRRWSRNVSERQLTSRSLYLCRKCLRFLQRGTSNCRANI
jgi:hypothetical protein